jgi:hypothetical protein
LNWSNVLGHLLGWTASVGFFAYILFAWPGI